VSSLTDLLGVPPAARIPHLDATPRSPFGNPTHEFADDAASLLAAMGVLAPQRRLV